MVSKVPDHVPDYVQTALDSIRKDMVELREDLETWRQFCVDKEDFYSRIENWEFNAWRRMEDILA